MSITSLFFPESRRAGLEPSLQRRVPLLVGVDLLLLIYFPLSSLLRYLAQPEIYGTFLVAILGTEAVFLASLALIRRGAYRAASWAGSLGTLLNVVWIGFLLPYSEVSELYRFGVYLIGAVVANAMVALGRRQIAAFFGIASLVYAAFVLGRALPAFGSTSEEFGSVAATLYLLVAAINLVMLSLAKLADGLVALAVERERESRERAEALSRLVEGSRAAIATARELSAASEESKRRSAEIRASLEGLLAEARGLHAYAREAEDSNREVVDRSRSVREAVGEEHALLSETGEALRRIALRLGELSRLAAERRETVSAVLQAAERQRTELAGLREGTDRLGRAGKQVLGAAGGIGDLSERTSLLAMNASIEAAHAGAAGKGFAVISQEVRKLAEETKAETLRIGEAIEGSEAATRAQAESVGRFAARSEAFARDVRETLDALASLIGGLEEAARETSGLEEGTVRLLALARRAGDKVEGVSGCLDRSAEGVSGLRDFARELQDKVEAILESFASIEASVAAAGLVGARSAAHVAELDAKLQEVEARTKIQAAEDAVEVLPA